MLQQAGMADSQEFVATQHAVEVVEPAVEVVQPVVEGMGNSSKESPSTSGAAEGGGSTTSTSQVPQPPSQDNDGGFSDLMVGESTTTHPPQMLHNLSLMDPQCQPATTGYSVLNDSSFWTTVFAFRPVMLTGPDSGPGFIAAMKPYFDWLSNCASSPGGTSLFF
jgi:hypothetical protein